MSELSQTFTDKLFAEYEVNAKFRALENAITHNGLLKSLRLVKVKLKMITSFLLI